MTAHGDDASSSRPAFLAWGPRVALVSAIAAVGVLPLLFTGAMSVRLQTELGFGEGALGASFAVVFGAAALSSAFLGQVSERFGPSLSHRLGSIVAVVSLLGIVTVASSWVILAGFLTLAGVGSTLARPAASLYIARLIPERRQGLAFGMKQATVLIASLVAGLLVQVALTVGSRWVFVIGAVLVVALAVPRERLTAGQALGIDRNDDLSVILFGLLTISVACATAGAFSLGAFTVPTMVGARFSEGGAGLFFAVASIAALASRLVVAWLADRREAGRLRFVAGMLAVGGGGFLLLASARQEILYLAVLVTFATAWAFLGLFNLAIVRMNPVAPAGATGIAQTGTFVGGVVGPWGLGGMAEQSSFTDAWLPAGGLTLVSAGMIMYVRNLVRGHGPIDLSTRPATASEPTGEADVDGPG